MSRSSSAFITLNDMRVTLQMLGIRWQQFSKTAYSQDCDLALLRQIDNSVFAFEDFPNRGVFIFWYHATPPRVFGNAVSSLDETIDKSICINWLIFSYLLLNFP